MISTLTDLIRFLDASEEVPDGQKRLLRSALNRTRHLLGNGLADIRADPREILARLDRLSPAMAGMRPRSLANVKSRMRTVFRLVAPVLAPARSHTQLTGPWQVLAQQLPVRERRQLSRFMRYAQAMGLAPDAIGEEQARQFEAYVTDEAMLVEAGKVVRITRAAWNRAVETVPGWPQQRLEPVPPKRTPYWLREDQLPASLREQITGYLASLAQPDPFLGPSRKALAPGTVDQHRIVCITLASALVGSGVPVERLTSLAVLVQPDHLERALRYLYARAGDRVTPQIALLPYRARRVAAHAGLPAQDLARLDQMLARVRQMTPPRRDLAAKNRRLLEHVDDQGFIDRLVTLPGRLMAAASRMTAGRLAAACARDAVAVELLLVTCLRVGNLVDLRLGETIRRFGEGATTRWAIEIPAPKVKNRQPLRFILPPESVQLLEHYLAHWHAHWCGAGSPWLFPNERGGHVDGRLLSVSIARRAQVHVGAPITCHQFRHLAAELVLREDPNGLGLVSQHLGHRDLNTTRRYYAREQTRVATQRYHEVLERQRAKASSPARARGRNHPSGKGPT